MDVDLQASSRGSRDFSVGILSYFCIKRIVKKYKLSKRGGRDDNDPH